mmetsp:Transcript_62604/g.123726  ORF Transcript_62604/g.123726 Transcript_62604/m.123726 type:complete len:198 (-) Transcript_62604:56-649(-)
MSLNFQHRRTATCVSLVFLLAFLQEASANNSLMQVLSSGQIQQVSANEAASLLTHKGAGEPSSEETESEDGEQSARSEKKESKATEERSQPAVARIAPFGKEDTAVELQRHAARTQDTLVDAVENAEVAEIKRSVFRALTRLRAAEIKEFDTIARLETQAIDEYNDNHHYRGENPIEYIHRDEQPVTKDKYQSFHNL